MKRHFLGSSMLVCIILLLGAIVVNFSSCKKNSSGLQFTGTYAGTTAIVHTTGPTNRDTMIITQGGVADSIFVEQKTTGAIARATTNGDSINIPYQQVISNGYNVIIIGSGSVSGNTLVLNLQELDSLGLNGYYLFTGSRQ